MCICFKIYALHVFHYQTEARRIIRYFTCIIMFHKHDKVSPRYLKVLIHIITLLPSSQISFERKVCMGFVLQIALSYSTDGISRICCTTEVSESTTRPVDVRISETERRHYVHITLTGSFARYYCCDK